MTRRSALLFVLICSVISVEVRGEGPGPWSFRSPGLPPLTAVPLVEMEAVDVPALLAEDAARAGEPIPLRVGWPMEVDLSLTTGAWADLEDGGRLWRLAVHSKEALWLVLGFGSFHLQAGGELRVFDPAGAHVLGPYTAADVADHGQLWTPPLAGDTAIVEIYWPKALANETPRFHLGTVSHGYKPVFGIGEPKDAEPDAGACEIDINCPLGADWQDDKHGVVVLLSGGSGYCSASLVANTAYDCTNYVLTANHCVSSQGGAAGTTFRFNYERPNCGSGTPPTNQNVSGSNLRATYGASDFTLLEVSSPVPPEFLPYYNGWTRSTSPASEAWGIHHPQTDEKKISHSPNPLVDGSSWGPDHWRVNWYSDGREGVTEPGSSGSPLFDLAHRIVGQLHGGGSSCSASPSSMWDEYGKVDVSWDGGGTPSSRLRDWLDPLGTGAVFADGHYCGGGPGPKLQYAGGTVSDPLGNANAAPEPGERFTLAVTVGNNGSQDATGVAGTLSTTHPLVTILDAAAVWPDVAPSSSAVSDAPHFLLQTDPSIPCGAAVPMHLDLTAAESPGLWGSDFSLFVGQPQPATPFSDAMEGGENGWTSVSLEGPQSWTLSDFTSHSPSHSWVISEARIRTDTSLRMPLLPALGPNAELRFWHRFSTENNYDGGVLEYSTNGTTWIDAGDLIASGGYNSSVVPTTNSPLAGRDCWAGDSVEWKEVVVDLSSLAGRDVRLRWRFATNDKASIGAGWAVDDVTVRATSYACSATPPGEASGPESASPFTIERAAGGYDLAWSAPAYGAAPTAYELYQTPLAAGPPADPACEADLGTGTAATLSSLTADQGFLVVARSAWGDGSYGRGSDGVERPQAAGVDLCP